MMSNKEVFGIELFGAFDVIRLMMVLLSYGIIAYWAFRIYKKKTAKPKIWKVLIVLFVGLFSFSINWTQESTLVRIPLLPLGVWILYFVFRGKEDRWQTYRSFAWLGFWANFLFLASTLLTNPIHQAVYPVHEPATYIADVDHSSILLTHPSATDQKLNKERLLQQLPHFTPETIYSNQWYMDTNMNIETNQRQERFPYQLVGTLAKWGSGLQSLIYIEEDGKGILITTPKQQLYFRSEHPIMEAVKQK